MVIRLDRHRNYYKNGIYHIYNRGNNKGNIFLDKNDYICYISLLKKYSDKYNAVLLGYCLMPNHIHLEIKQNSGIPLSKYVSGLHASYTNYFNKKYNKIGHLFQGRFKAKEIKSETQLLELIFYIHLNPVSANLTKFPEDWPWSSAQDYAGERNGTLCDKIIILKLLRNLEEYKIILKEKMDKKKWEKIGDLLFD